jgi:hypothetical protein
MNIQNQLEQDRDLLDRMVRKEAELSGHSERDWPFVAGYLRGTLTTLMRKFPEIREHLKQCDAAIPEPKQPHV